MNDRDDDNAPAGAGVSRRDFLTSSTAGAAGVAAGALLPGARPVYAYAGEQAAPPVPRGRRMLLKGGMVLTMDPKLGNFEKADVLIEGKKIVAVGPNLGGGGQAVDATGMIVMPGFIQTHHHRYETIQRAILADGILSSPWPQESYQSVVQSIWTTGRIAGAQGQPPIWDLGRSPYDPEDCYISELVAALTSIDQGVTAAVDTSQSSHTPAHTDAMIEGLMDSGQRALYVYTGGRNDQPGYEFPGAIGDTTKGLGRLRTQYFSSEDQLVTLGFGGGPTPAFPGATYSGWELARSFGAVINNHNVGAPQTIVNNADQLGPDITFVHAVRWTEEAWQIASAKGVHISIAGIIEMQMRHGMPPFQAALDHGILPSLSPDVDTNMTAEMFPQMRGAFCLQRALLNDRFFAGEQNLPPLLTCQQVLEMATVAGAASMRLQDKIGSLTPGKEADVIVLDATALNVAPLNNGPGAVVTLMNSSNVRHVIIAGKVMKWQGRLVNVNWNRLRRQIENSRDRVLARIKSVPIPVDGLHSAPGYTPSRIGSCCIDDTYDVRP